MLNLGIEHFIWLTKPQRYALHNGVDLVVVGASIPVWSLNKITSEPAREVFCHYYLKNTQEDTPIRILEDGYEIVIPYREGKPLEVSDEEWRQLNFQNPEMLEKLYKQRITKVSSDFLLDVSDGGCGSMSYREANKLRNGDTTLNIVHYVNIHDMEQLTSSLT